MQLGNLKVNCLLLKLNHKLLSRTRNLLSHRKFFLNRKLRVRFRLGLINILSASVVIKLVWAANSLPQVIPVGRYVIRLRDVMLKRKMRVRLVWRPLNGKKKIHYYVHLFYSDCLDELQLIPKLNYIISHPKFEMSNTNLWLWLNPLTAQMTVWDICAFWLRQWCQCLQWVNI